MKTRSFAAFFAAVLFLLLGARSVHATGIQLDIPEPSLERWMYPFNFDPSSRAVSSTFASFDPRFDTRDAQFLIGWDTAALVPTNKPGSHYLLRRARLTLTEVVVAGQAFLYDPSFDSYRTYATNTPIYTPDTDAGRPIELYGAGFRNGFTAATFPQGGYYGPLNAFTSTNISIATRSVYAAQFDDSGVLVDVSNNVGQYNAGWTNASFEAHPWAIGVSADATPGEYVPDDAKFTFDIRLDDPHVQSYFRTALAEGHLRLIVSSLSPAQQITPGGTGQGGVGSYPQWATRDNLVYDAPRLELEGVLVSDADTDVDGLPDDWENFYFGNLAQGANDDPDHDSVGNLAEWNRGTDPTVADPLPPSIANLRVVQVEADGTVTLQFGSDIARQHRVEVSFDLINWRAGLGEFASGGDGVVLWKETDPTVPPAGRSKAFYRVAVE